WSCIQTWCRRRPGRGAWGAAGSRCTTRGTRFLRVTPGFMCQSRDVAHNDGTGLESIYCGKFVDENFTRKHRGPGLLSMANGGRDMNAPWLDGKQVVFGRVVEGMTVVKAIDLMGSMSGENKTEVLVADCGQLS
ncbi:PPIases accelerate the folding of proteins (By similarity), partial [Musa troglodytarum]